MNYWILKSEPDVYSYDDLVKQGVGTWDGVRNYTARNNLKAMKVGDLAFFLPQQHWKRNCWDCQNRQRSIS
jgi:predicted RNA-binding protein with PUA-like domain